MKLILKKGELGLRQDLLIEGADYDVFRDRKSLGTAKYLNDPIHGHGFFIKKMRNGRKILQVCVVDEWVFPT